MDFWLARYALEGVMTKGPMGKDKKQLVDCMERRGHSDRMRIQHRICLNDLATRLHRTQASDLEEHVLLPIVTKLDTNLEFWPKSTALILWECKVERSWRLWIQGHDKGLPQKETFEMVVVFFAVHKSHRSTE